MTKDTFSQSEYEKRIEGVIERVYGQTSYVVERSFRFLPDSVKNDLALQYLVGMNNLFDYRSSVFRAIRDPMMFKKDNDFNITQKIGIPFEGGKSGAKLKNAVLFIGPGVVDLPARVELYNPFPKDHPTENLAKIEYAILNAFQNDSLANVVKVHNIEKDKVYISRSNGLNLWYKSYFQKDLNISDSVLIDDYKKLIDESIHIAVELTEKNRISNNIKDLALDEKYLPVMKKFSISRIEAENNYHTLKMLEALKLENEPVLMKEFKELMAPIQEFIIRYNSDNAIWISERSPRNKSEENYDFAGLFKDSFATELTNILTMVPDLRIKCDSYKNNIYESLINYGINACNKSFSNKIFDMDSFSDSFYGAELYRSVRNIGSNLTEAKAIIENRYGSIQFFEYAPRIKDASSFAAIANNSVYGLVKRKTDSGKEFGVIDVEHANNLSQFITNRSKFLSNAVVPLEDAMEDYKIYSSNKQLFIPEFYKNKQNVV